MVIVALGVSNLRGMRGNHAITFGRSLRGLAANGDGVVYHDREA